MADVSGGDTSTLPGDESVGKCDVRLLTNTYELGSRVTDADQSPYFPPGCCDRDLDPDYCVPWHHATGFFHGDGTYQGIDLVVDRSEVELTSLGTIFSATATFQHVYKARQLLNGAPFKAAFFGGNRDDVAQVSGGGRPRIETTVNIQAMQCASPL